MDNQTEQSPVPEAQNPPVRLEAPRKSFMMRQVPFLVVLVLLLFIAGIFSYKQYLKNHPSQGPANNPVAMAPLETTSSTSDQSIPTATPDTNLAFDPVMFQQCKNRLPALSSRSGLASWQTPEKLVNVHIFAPATDGDNYTDTDYLVGRFTGGKYKGGDIIVMAAQDVGPSVPEYFILVRINGKYHSLSKYSEALPKPDQYTTYEITVAPDNDFTLSDLEYPQTLSLDNPKAQFVLAPSAGFFRNAGEFFCADRLVKVFADPAAGDVYTDSDVISASKGTQFLPRHGYYVKRADGMLLTYQLVIDFAGQNKVPLLTWSDNKKNTAEYSYQSIGGCGVSNFSDIADIKLTDVKTTGTTINSQQVYEYRDSHNPELQNMYDNMFVPEGQKKISYEAFIADHPIFFWQNPFGKFVRFHTIKYQPLAECGKPVIYLYPQKTQAVHVEVAPQGGMSYSDPLYNSGWDVMAEPNGSLTQISSGKSYPYLFWEGRGGMYQTPQKGFMVEKSNVHGFLVDKLKLLGLNGQESKDFMEFWEPKMQSAPYYFVTFMGNKIMDSLAPLTIDPKPDTVIRILMDFTPLEKPMVVESYTIHTPVRNGFTIVEWGGVLR